VILRILFFVQDARAEGVLYALIIRAPRLVQVTFVRHFAVSDRLESQVFYEGTVNFQAIFIEKMAVVSVGKNNF
jgi:hypothetical protein